MKGSMKVLPYLCILVLLSGAVGCVNIFSFASNKEKTPVAKAEEDIRNGDYQKAMDELTVNGVLKDSTDSVVLYTYAKATLLDAGVDLGEIVDLVQGKATAQKGMNNPILQKIEEFSEEKQTAWYQSNTEVSNLLEKIYKNEATGVFTKDDIALDYTISNIISSVIGLRDTNQDGVINYESDIQLDLISIGGTADLSNGFVLGKIQKDTLGNPVLDQNGVPKNMGLMVFLGNWTGKLAKPAGTAVEKHNYTPDDINRIISFILTKLDKGEESILYLLQLYANNNGEVSSIDYNEIKDYIAQIGKYINFYWYDDGIDNDGDGRIDEETINGVDDDGDGLIDEDSDYHPSDPTTEENKQYSAIFYDWENR